jgi:hypothetical protein
MKFRGGEFSIGTTGNFQPELTSAASTARSLGIQCPSTYDSYICLHCQVSDHGHGPPLRRSCSGSLLCGDLWRPALNNRSVSSHNLITGQLRFLPRLMGSVRSSMSPIVITPTRDIHMALRTMKEGDRSVPPFGDSTAGNCAQRHCASFRYSTSCRFKAMRTPLTRMTL